MIVEDKGNEKKTCDRCAADCSRGWSERWRGDTAETAVCVEIVCRDCDLDEHMAEYRKTGRLNNKVVLPAALYKQTSSYMTDGKDGGWVEWMRTHDRADQRRRIAEEVKTTRERYGADYDKINAETTALTDLIARFEREVWFGWLKAYYAGTNLRGHSAQVSDLVMLVWGCAGRLMTTLRRGDAESITLICAEDSDTHTMGVQGYDCTGAQGQALLSEAVALSVALAGAIGPARDVGIGL